jgi:transcription initiation factor TFIIIB Brf1 subunit/transcription initiation factor TFIIB
MGYAMNEKCPVCGNNSWVKAAAGNHFVCRQCTGMPTAEAEPEPPPAPVVITSQAIVTWCRPWCLACGGWQAIEREYSDGSHRINCRTCGVVLEDRPMFDWPKKKRKEGAEDGTAENQ